MIELLQNYNLVEILIVLVMAALAVKGAVDLWEWQAKHFWKTVDNIKHKDKQEAQIVDNSSEIAEIRKELQQINKKVDNLIQSDKEGIKAYILEKHRYYCYDAKEIDEHTLEILEKRYATYRNEGGNSFVVQLMDDIRELPRKVV